MKTIIFATTNEGKLKEIRAILGGPDVQVLSMHEAGLDPEIKEDGKSFEENAVIKAAQVMKFLKTEAAIPGIDASDCIVMADDSGLEIEALGGEPGIYSARYMGEETSYDIKNAALIERLTDVPDPKRSARFVCAIAAAMSDDTVITTRGTIEGRIGYEARGENGFGYDPIFYLPDRDITTAELSPAEKNAISHRGNALRAMRDAFKKRGLL